MTDVASLHYRVVAETQRLARELLGQVVDLAAEVTSTVAAEVPRVVPVEIPDSYDALRESTEQNLGAILSMLAFDAVPAALEPPAGTLRTLDRIIAVGGSVTDLLRAFRVGQAAVWHLWSDHVERCGDPELALKVLTRSTAQLFVYVDGACEQIVVRHAELYPAARRARPAREGTLDSLLAGQLLDEVRAGTALGLELRRHHIGLTIRAVAADADERAVCGDLVQQLPDADLWTHRAADGSTWVWLSWPTPPDPGVLAELSGMATPGVVVGVGRPAFGRDGFRRTNLDAREAERMALLSASSSGGVTLHQDVELAAVLLSGSPDRARQFAAELPGALASADDATSKVRETLRTFLDTNGSHKVTAARLGVHAKTVANRIMRAEELLGRRVDKAQGPLRIALEIHHAIRLSES